MLGRNSPCSVPSARCLFARRGRGRWGCTCRSARGWTCVCIGPVDKKDRNPHLFYLFILNGDFIVFDKNTESCDVFLLPFSSQIRFISSSNWAIFLPKKNFTILRHVILNVSFCIISTHFNTTLIVLNLRSATRGSEVTSGFFVYGEKISLYF